MAEHWKLLDPAAVLEQKLGPAQQLVAEASLHFSPSLIHAVHTVVPEPGKVSKHAEFSPQHVSFEPAEHVSPAGIHVGGGGGACVVEIVVVDDGGGDVELVIADKTHL